MFDKLRNLLKSKDDDYSWCYDIEKEKIGDFKIFRVCPACKTYHDSSIAICPRCGEALHDGNQIIAREIITVFKQYYPFSLTASRIVRIEIKNGKFKPSELFDKQGESIVIKFVD